MDQDEVAALRTDLRTQEREIERIYDRVEERAAALVRGASTEAHPEEALAFQLHNLYSTFEELFGIVAGAFENHITGEAGYHSELLRRMSVAVDGVRPAVIPENLLQRFDSLRSFRHFFRHAYGQTIDTRKLDPVLEDARLLRTEYPGMIEEFLQALQ
ncbi:MAG: hypothetical protein ACOCYC_00330 [bacterium]